MYFHCRILTKEPNATTPDEIFTEQNCYLLYNGAENYVLYLETRGRLINTRASLCTNTTIQNYHDMR